MNFFEEFMLRRNTIRLGDEEDTPESMRTMLEGLEVSEEGGKVRLEIHPPIADDLLALAAEKLASMEIDLVIVGKPALEPLQLGFISRYAKASGLTVEKDSGQPRGLLMGMLFSFETEEAKVAKDDQSPLLVDFTMGSPLPALAAVTLTRLKTDFSALALCSAIESLTLVDCLEVDLTPLAALPNLKSLTIQEEQCHSLTSLPGLELLTSLEHLHLGKVEQLAHLPNLSGLHGLRRVELLEMKSLESLSFLAGNSALEQLVVEQAGKLEPEAFQELKGLPNLKRGLIRLRRLKLSLAARKILPLEFPKSADEKETESDDSIAAETPETPEATTGPVGIVDASKAHAFWDWFSREKNRFISIGPAPRGPEELEAHMQKLGPLVNEISTELKKAHENLAVELQLDPELSGHREIIISADGQKDHFPAVKALCELAPAIEGWQVVQLRQPKPGFLDNEGGMIKMHGLTLKITDAFFEAEPVDEEGRRAIIFYFPGYQDGLPKQEKNAYLGVMFITLDSLLGERCVATQVGEFDLVPLDERPAEARPLTELANVFMSL